MNFLIPLKNIFKSSFKKINEKQLLNTFKTPSKYSMDQYFNSLSELIGYQEFLEKYSKFFKAYIEIETGNNMKDNIEELENSDLSISKVYLGYIYLNGIGVLVNYEKAIEYLSKAASIDKEAIYYLGEAYVKLGQYEKAFFCFDSLSQDDNRRNLSLAKMYLEGQGTIKKSFEARKLLEKCDPTPESNFYLGRMYEKGLGGERQVQKGLQLLRASAEENWGPSILYLSNIYANGQTVQQNREFAFKLNYKGAELGFLKCKYRVGEYYFEIGDYKSAIPYLEGLLRTSERSKASIYLGRIYYHAPPGIRNLSRAKDYLEPYKLDSGICNYYLGLIYLEENEISYGIDLIEIATDFNYYPAAVLLGNFYLQGKYVTKDESKGIDYLKSAVEFDGNASLNLGMYYYEKKDYQNCITYFEQAFNKKILTAGIYLGEIYLKGLIGTINFDKAKEYLVRAVETEIPLSFYYYGVLLMKLNNKTDGLLFLENASKYNEPNSLLFLGKYYYDQGDFEKSLHNLKSAYKKGHLESCLYLGQIYFFGNGVEKDYQKAKDYFEKINSITASNFLGEMYLYGLGVEKDTKKAKEIFEYGMKYNSKNSIKFLVEMYKSGIGVTENKQKARELEEILK